MKEHRMQRRTLLAGATAAGLAMATGGSWAQSAWPNKPVNLVVPFPAGGGTDAFARPLAAQFSKVTGKTLVIDNRGGAGGTVGASYAAKGAPDGYTLFMGAVHHAIAPSMYPRLDYNIEKDFVPLALLANVPQVLVINPKAVPVSNFKQFLEHVKRNPAKLNYGSAGAGTSHHLAGELFKQQTGTFITHIPYRGAGPALQDLIAGNVDMMFDGLGSSATRTSTMLASLSHTFSMPGMARRASMRTVRCARSSAAWAANTSACSSANRAASQLSTLTL